MAMTLQQVADHTAAPSRFYRIHLIGGQSIMGMRTIAPAQGLLTIRKPKGPTGNTLMVVIDVQSIAAIEMEE